MIVHKRISKLPKTFVLLAETKDGKSGYVRLRGRLENAGNYTYGITLTRRISDASVYIGLDTLKIKARQMKDENGFSRIEIIDMATKKSHVIQ